MISSWSCPWAERPALAMLLVTSLAELTMTGRLPRSLSMLSSADSLTEAMASICAPLDLIRPSSRSACWVIRSAARRPSESRSRFCEAMNSRARLSSRFTTESRCSRLSASLRSWRAASLNRAASRVLVRRATSHSTQMTSTGGDQPETSAMACCGEIPPAMPGQFAQPKNAVQPRIAASARLARIAVPRAGRGCSSSSQVSCAVHCSSTVAECGCSGCGSSEPEPKAMIRDPPVMTSGYHG